MGRLPDFIIAGAMKAATSTLQEQLAVQPGIFMTSPKEPNFFSDDEIYAKGMNWYQELYATARAGDILGEASTHYTKLPTYPDTVPRLKRHLPGARFVYVMRHPVDRLVSHYIHEWSMGSYGLQIEAAIERYPELVTYGKYAEQLEPLFKVFGKQAVLPVFFDRLIEAPQDELERVCKFIGYEGKPEWSPELKPGNVSSERIRRFPLYGLLVDSVPAAWLRRRLVPWALRDAVKRRLTMQQRPELGKLCRQHLEVEFDRDLARLGGWLGIELDCKVFRQVTAAGPLDWIDA